MKDNTIYPTYEYYNFPKQFLSYRWYRPLLVLLLTLAFMLVLQLIVIAVIAAWSGDMAFLLRLFEDLSLESADAYTGPGALFTLATIAVILPAMFFATLIIRDRPFSSYASSRGGWNWGAFFKCLGVCAAVYGAFTLLDLLILDPGGAEGGMVFTLSGFIVITLVCPIQCMAEEYLCRGFIFQTAGSWIGKPLIAVIIQSVIFMLLHIYDIYGMLAILIMGFTMGVLTWKTNGLEAGGALHIVNNMFAFYLVGFGIDSMESESNLAALLICALQCFIFAFIVLKIGKKRGWFRSKGDVTSAFNQKILRKERERQEALQAQNDQTV